MTFARSQLLRAISLACVTLVACTTKRTSPSVSPTPAQSLAMELEAATQRYATLLRTGPADSVAASFSANGVLAIQGVEPAVGRRAILAFLAPMSAQTTVESVSMTIDSTATDGPIVRQLGHYRQVAGPKGGATQAYVGRYRALWERGRDGRWRFARLEMFPEQ